MGSWNETCNLSHLPICCGDRVYAMLVAGKNRPLFFPFKGIYNDYGSLEEIEEDENTAHIFSTITASRQVFEFEYEDHNKEYFDNASKSFEELLKAVERSLLYKNTFRDMAPVRLVFFREDVYNRILEATGDSDCWRDKTERSDIVKKIARARDAIKLDGSRARAIFMLDDVGINMCYVKHVNHGYAYKVEDIEDYFTRTTDMHLLLRYYEKTNRDLDFIQMGRGGQDEEYDFWLSMNEIMVDECRKTKTIREEEME